MRISGGGRCREQLRVDELLGTVSVKVEGLGGLSGTPYIYIHM